MSGPKAQPLFVLVGEGHRKELFLYVKVALSYFKSTNEISKATLPLAPAKHLLAQSKGPLLFPGKIKSFKANDSEKIVISDTGNNRILIVDENNKVQHVVGGCESGFKDGSFQKAKFNAPQGICCLDNVIYVADNENHAIRKVLFEKNQLLEYIVSIILGTFY